MKIVFKYAPLLKAQFILGFETRGPQNDIKPHLGMGCGGPELLEGQELVMVVVVMMMVMVMMVTE